MLQLRTAGDDMKTDRSNVHMTSNVYPVKAEDGRINMSQNEDFVANVADRSALRGVVEMRYGRLSDWRLYERYARTIPGLREWQVRAIVHADSGPGCDRGDRPWGPVRRGDTILEECRCDKTACAYFRQCRPDREKPNANQ